MKHTGRLIVLGQDGAIPYVVAEGMVRGAHRLRRPRLAYARRE